MKRKSRPGRVRGQDWPQEFGRGSFHGRIYRLAKVVKGRSYLVHRVAYYDPGGRRITRDFAGLADARQAADDACVAFGLGRADALSFTPEERQQFDSAVALLEPHGLNPYTAAVQIDEALRALPAGVRLLEAVRDYAARHPATTVLVADAVQALIADREAAKLSEQYVARLEQGLERFATAFNGPLSSVTPPQISEWLGSLKGPDKEPVGNRTRKNYLGHVVTLFRFAGSRKWASRQQVEEVCEIPAPKSEATGDVGVFTPAEIRTLLNSCEEDTLSLLAIGAFAGLRTAELMRLDWRDVRLGERVIIVAAAKAKTGSRRVVPVADNLAGWLAPRVKAEGIIAEGLDDRIVTQRWGRMASRSGVEWKHNGLRHSFCSYRLAVVHDPAKVAFEAGNSAAMVHSHYKALVTEAEGREWFEVRPGTGAGSVIPLPKEVRHAA